MPWRANGAPPWLSASGGTGFRCCTVPRDGSAGARKGGVAGEQLAGNEGVQPGLVGEGGAEGAPDALQLLLGRVPDGPQVRGVHLRVAAELAKILVEQCRVEGGS